MDETEAGDLTVNDELGGCSASPSLMSFLNDTDRNIDELEKFSLDSIANQVMEQVSGLGENLKSFRNEGYVAIEILQAAMNQVNGINAELLEQRSCIENWNQQVNAVYPNHLGDLSSHSSTAGPSSRTNTPIPQFSYRTAPQQQSPERIPDDMDVNNELPVQ